MLSLSSLAVYWTSAELATNGLIFLNLLGALLLGLTLGYERSYRSRAAGMRTYGLVCMASAGLTVIVGYPGFWFGGHAVELAGADPTRVIQGIVTGIGFLGAGVIMKEGFNISGLTTAASIWASSVIGVMIGLGFYLAAISLAVLSLCCMVFGARLELWLPSRQTVAIVVRFKSNFLPSEEAMRSRALEHGYEIADSTVSIGFQDNKPEWRFVVVALSRQRASPISRLAQELAKFEGIDSFQLARSHT